MKAILKPLKSNSINFSVSSASPSPGKYGRRLFFLILLSFVLSSGLHAEPSFPALAGRVNDQAGLLSAPQQAALSSQLEQHEEQTGNQVVVVTVKSLQGYAISDFTNRLGRFWKIGQAERDNGVILLVAPTERKVRIEVGYGLEGALTDATSADIIRRRILPSFREDDYPGGIQRGTDNILKAIAGEYKIEPQALRDKSQEPLQGYFPLIFIAMIAVLEALKRFGWSRLGNTGFPTAFMGIGATAISQSIWIGLAVSTAIFIMLYFFIKPRGGGNGSRGHSHSDRDERSNRGIIGSGTRGGFSGGGGSFGGGGASGGW